MKTLFPPLMLALAASSASAQTAAPPLPAPEASTPALPAVTVSATAEEPALAAAVQRTGATLQSLRLGSNDAARLLDGLPGVSLYGAGGVSALPAIHGLADDRLRVQVDGMDLMAACPNHMNSPLSYIDAAQVGEVRVYAGITPVSVGGDSLGGTIQIEAPAPRFAAPGQPILVQGHAGSSYRSNGQAHSADAALLVAGENLSLRYSAATTQSSDIHTDKAFKASDSTLAGDEIGSSAYHARNQSLNLAYQLDRHLLQLGASVQDIPFEGFSNQRMDMTHNQSTQLNARYQGSYDWGELQGQLYSQHTRHAMDMGPDRNTYGTGMPMDTRATTTGSRIMAILPWTKQDVLRLGGEAQDYTLYDWWPPVGGTMGPNAFWNVNDGERRRRDGFAEWEHQWSPDWSTLLGLRLSDVRTKAGPVQGYNNALGTLWGNEVAAFNAGDRSRSDLMTDLTALARLTPEPGERYEVGYARKSRAPNLYQRYPWSTQPMAALMNNFVGDGNGYIGNPDLRPEVAHTLSLTGDWHARNAEGAPTPVEPDWQLRANAYLTWIDGYIDAQRCTFGQCGSANASTNGGFVLLQYVNQRARLGGLDLSGRTVLSRDGRWGTLSASGVLNWVQGRNQTTGDGLYNLMPLNGRWALTQSLGTWSQTLEWLTVAAKTRVSQVRNEMPTPGYTLLNWRASYHLGAVRIDLGIDNLFNRAYSLPLGGAYLGQGSSMAINGIAWGTPMPGQGRSIQVGLRYDF